MQTNEREKHAEEVRFGVIADLQFYDGPPFKNRYFRASKKKLKQAIHTFNQADLDFVVNLGDTIDRDWHSYGEILPEFDNLTAKVYHVLGNHDYEVDESKLEEVPQILAIPEYYMFSTSRWRFIVLNGNQISTFANPIDSEAYKQAADWLEEMEQERKINGQFYNGGIGQDQLVWLEDQLKDAQSTKQAVIIFCHYPIYPYNKHNLLNADLVLEHVQKSSAVKAWFCGHNHKGNYGQHANVHFINMKGMVEGVAEMAYATVSLSDQNIIISGFGSEISARLAIDPLQH